MNNSETTENDKEEKRTLLFLPQCTASRDISLDGK